MKPIAWYDPTNGMVSTDNDCPLFTPLGQIWGLYPKEEWVGLTDEEIEASKPTRSNDAVVWELAVEWAEAKLKEKNT
jgi:hypothetical protein